LSPRLSGFGGKGIRTPDFQLAKLALYQLSYAPGELSILNCRLRIANLADEDACQPGRLATASASSGRQGACATKIPDDELEVRHPAFLRFF
jgi:hypothetical protein